MREIKLILTVPEEFVLASDLEIMVDFWKSPFHWKKHLTPVLRYCSACGAVRERVGKRCTCD